MNIKFSQKVSDFIEANAGTYDDYRILPVYKKISDGIYEYVDVNKIPEDVKKFIVASVTSTSPKP